MRELLVVFQGAFSRGWGGAVARLLPMAESLQPLGWHTTVLAQRVDSPAGADGPERQFPGDVVLVKPWQLWANQWGLQRALHRLFDADGAYAGPETGWGARAPYWYRQHRGHSRPDAVMGISVGGLRDAAAARTLAEQEGCPLFLDFHDPCPYPGNALTEAEERCLRRCLDACAGVVTATGAFAHHLNDTYAECSGKAGAIYMSYDDNPVPGARERRDGPLVLLHAGKLHGGEKRNAAPLVHAIARACERETDAQGQIQLRLLGAGQGGAEAVQVAQALGVGEAVVDLPQVPMDEARTAMDQADVLVVIKFADPAWNMQIPGKTFHYLGRRKPVLGVMGECEAADIIRRSGLGTTFAHGEVDALAGHLLHLWRNRRQLPELCAPDEEYIARFSRTRMAESFRQVLMRAVDTNAGLSA